MDEEKAFLFRISDKLSTKQKKALVSICDLPPDMRDQDAFDVLLELKRREKYNELEELATILKGINRNDLAKEVTTFAKNNKRKKRGLQSECTTQLVHFNSVLLETQQNLEALKDQIETLWDVANDEGYKQAKRVLQKDVKPYSEKLTKKLQHVSELLPTEKQAAKNLSPSSSTSSTSSEEGNEATAIANNEIQEKSKSHSRPRHSVPASPHQRTKQPPLLPPTANKPAVQCTEDHIPIRPGVMMMPTPQLPSLKELQAHMPPKSPVLQTNRPTPSPKPKVKPKPTRLSVTVRPNRTNQPVNKVVDNEYDEIAYGDGTGDSGFAEASEFLRPEVKRKPQAQPPSAHDQQPGEYAGLNNPTIDPPGYYKTRQKDSKVKKDFANEDDDAYEYVDPRTITS